MAKDTKTSGRASGSYTLGRNAFEKISAVEGIKTSQRVNEDFKEFDRRGLSSEQRRQEIARKYGPKR